MWMAPGYGPRPTRPRSRTSIQAASSIAAPRASSWSMSALTCWRSPCSRHDFKNDSSLFAHSRGRWRQALGTVPGECPKRVEVSSSPRQPSLLRRRRRDHPANTQTPHQPQVRKSRRPCREPAGAVGPPIEQAFKDWPKGSIDAAADRAAVSKNAQVQLYRGIALIWAGYRATRRPLERAKLGATRSSRCGPTTCSTRRTSSPPLRRARSPAARPNRLLEQGSRLQAQGTRSRPSASTSRRRPGRTTTRRRWPLPSGFDEDNLTPAFSRLGRSRALSAQPVVRYYLAAPRLDRTVGRVAQAVPGGRRARPDDRARQVRRRVRHRATSGGHAPAEARRCHQSVRRR